MPQASILGKTYHYILNNAGGSHQPTAVFVHGAGGDHTVWLAQFDALRTAAPELVESYVAMARRTLVVARAKGGISAESAAALATLLD